jgi:N-acetylmuramoyl-L-alanine amidase
MSQTRILILSLLISSSVLAKPRIVIDSGHEPSQPGATGTCLIKEVIYNDKMVSAIAQTLNASYQIILTREPGQDVAIDSEVLKKYLPLSESMAWQSKKSLFARPAYANLHHADIFISIHHDSTLIEHQVHDPLLCDQRGGTNLTDAFKQKYKIGFNIFINDADKTPNKARSLLLAKLLGKQLLAIGRVPSDYHVYPVDACQSCYPVNKTLGIWHENLAVLRNVNMPAVLIEVGNIVDPRDERIINSDAFRKDFSHALEQALNDYFSHSEK